MNGDELAARVVATALAAVPSDVARLMFDEPAPLLVSDVRRVGSRVGFTVNGLPFGFDVRAGEP